MERCELSHKGEKNQERSQLEDEERKVTCRDQRVRRVIKGAVVVTIKTEMGKKWFQNEKTRGKKFHDVAVNNTWTVGDSTCKR